MLKKEYYDYLISVGFEKDSLDGKTKDVLVRLYDDYLETLPEEAPKAAPVNKDELTINSKLRDKYIMEDGSEILFKDIPHLITPGYLSPFQKAKDKLKKEAGKWIAVSLLLLMGTGCSITGPYTGSKYEIGANDDVGIYMSVKIFDSDTVTNGVVKAYDWVAGDEEDEKEDGKKE